MSKRDCDKPEYRCTPGPLARQEPAPTPERPTTEEEGISAEEAARLGYKLSAERGVPTEEGEEERLAEDYWLREANEDSDCNQGGHFSAAEIRKAALWGLREGKRLAAPGMIGNHWVSRWLHEAQLAAALERNAKLLRDIDTLSVEHGKAMDAAQTEVERLKKAVDRLERKDFEAAHMRAEHARERAEKVAALEAELASLREENERLKRRELFLDSAESDAIAESTRLRELLRELKEMVAQIETE